MPNDDLQGDGTIGEYVAVMDGPADAPLLTPTEDGGAWVDLPGEPPKEHAPDDIGFYANLAGVFDQSTRSGITTDLYPKVEEDKQVREKRTQLYAEGIRRTGLANDAPGGASFEGASRAVHPMLLKAAVDYESRIMKELWPIAGPVKSKILGTVTADKQARADRKAAHMNWQLLEQIKEARAVMETTLTQVPMGGSQFIRQWWDHRLKRPRWQFAGIDNILVPASAESFESAQRKTFVERITTQEYQLRVAAGQYLDQDLPPPPSIPDPNPAEQASQKVQGVNDSGAVNLDGDRDVFETVVYLEVTQNMLDQMPEGSPEQVGDLCPYLITMDSVGRDMMAMYRAWEDGDDAYEPIEHLFEFPFIPWRGCFSLGFPHLIGGLSAAATGALRALLDSAHANNVTGGLLLKGAAASGQTVTPQIGTFTEIEAGNVQADDIRKVAMPFTFTQPSPVLMELLGFLVSAAEDMVRTSLDESATNMPSPDTPVGTQMSRVEEGLTVFTAVHGRAHAALNRLLRGLHRLNRLYLPDELMVTPEQQAGGQAEIFIKRADYEGPTDIEPTSDPTIYSDLQRFNQLAYIQQRAALNPQLWKLREVEKAGLTLIKWPDPESLLMDQPQPHELNAVNENLAMALGRPVQVFPEQNHLAHLQVLLDFMKSPVLGANPLIAPKYLPQALQHAAQHIVYLYVEQSINVAEEALREDPSKLISNDPRVKKEFDGLLAMAAERATMALPQLLAQAEPVLQAAMQMLKSMQPPPPMDPAAAAVQASTQETQRKSADDQASNEIARATLALKGQQVQQDAQKDQADNQTKVTVTAMDNQTARDISATRALSGKGGGFTDGASLAGS